MRCLRANRSTHGTAREDLFDTETKTAHLRRVRAWQRKKKAILTSSEKPAAAGPKLDTVRSRPPRCKRIDRNTHDKRPRKPHSWFNFVITGQQNSIGNVYRWPPYTGGPIPDGPCTLLTANYGFFLITNHLRTSFSLYSPGNLPPINRRRLIIFTISVFYLQGCRWAITYRCFNITANW